MEDMSNGSPNPFFEDDDDEKPKKKVARRRDRESSLPSMEELPSLQEEASPPPPLPSPFTFEEAEEIDFALPSVSLGLLDSGEVKEVHMADAVEDPGEELFFTLESFIEAEGHKETEAPREHVEDPSGEFLGDYASDLDDNLDAVLSRMAAMNDHEETEIGGGVESAFSSDFEEEEEDLFKGFDLDSVLGAAIDAGASDVHLTADDHVSFTILGEIHRQPRFDPPDGIILTRVQQHIIGHVLQSSFIQDLELDTSYTLKTGPHAGRRTRLSVGKSFGEIFMVFRIIADIFPTPEELAIPKEIIGWTDLPSGLVMVNGPTGTGKTTTLASLVRRVQLEKHKKIITLERPVEFLYGVDGKGVVTQREIGRDARSFAAALTSALRQLPDIILVGEVRNRIEVNELLRAAETGHLAISTMHTNSAPTTVNRIMSLYEGDDQRRILSTLSEVLRGLANQVLVKTKDGKGRFAVREVLSIDEEVSRLILQGDVEGIRKYQYDRGITMEHELVNAYLAGRCTLEAAREASAFPALFNTILKDSE